MALLQKRSSLFRPRQAPVGEPPLVDSPIVDAPIVDAPLIEAPASPMPDAVDRRQNQRIRQQCVAEISPWVNNKAGTAFSVVLDNFSTAGVGMIHSGRLQVGSRYLLEIARPGQRPLASIFTVVRCDETDGGLFDVDLAADDVLDVAFSISQRRKGRGKGKGRVRLIALVVAFTISAAAVFISLV
jgi:hypothetical protein